MQSEEKTVHSSLPSGCCLSLPHPTANEDIAAAPPVSHLIDPHAYPLIYQTHSYCNLDKIYPAINFNNKRSWGSTLSRSHMRGIGGGGLTVVAL